MYEVYYKDARITLIEVVLVPFFDFDFEHDLVCWNFFRNNQLEEFSKIAMKTFRNFQGNITKRDSQRPYSSEVAVHSRISNKCF